MSNSADNEIRTARQEATRVQTIKVVGGKVVPEGPAREEDLKWTPQRMVRWFSPGQLAVTGLRAVLSSVFGSYTDRRELQAALAAAEKPAKGVPNLADLDGEVFDYTQHAEPSTGFWIDYISDLGDGFEPTYTMAWLLAQPSLPAPAAVDDVRGVDRRATVANPVDQPMPQGWTRRGHVLVMGGDQVYPTATRDEYTNRLAGPYDAALPWTDEPRVPHLFAIPGNHDWYDGLTSFLRLFCQTRWIGGWKTQQKRSYFALELPNRWWLLGLDVQLESDIDQPQRDYFCRVASRMKPGDRVILCTAEPGWVHVPVKESSYDNLAYFGRTVLPDGVEVSVTLAGDLHHYVRYSDQSGRRHKVTSGGGGAYLLGTSLMPDEIDLPMPNQESGGSMARTTPARDRFKREQAYPSPAVSTSMKPGALRLPISNPSFTAFMGVMYLLYAWFLESASLAALPGDSLMQIAAQTSVGGWRDVFWGVYLSAAHSPLVIAFSLLFVAGLAAFCMPDLQRFPVLARSHRLHVMTKFVVGLVHGGAHILLVVSLLWLFSWINLVGLEMQTTNLSQIALFVVEMIAVGGVLAAVLMSLFLLPPTNYNEAFSAQHLETYKNFVRMHIAPDTGELTIYAYGVDDPADWEFSPSAEPGEPYFRATTPPRVRLIDRIVVRPREMG